MGDTDFGRRRVLTHGTLATLWKTGTKLADPVNIYPILRPVKSLLKEHIYRGSISIPAEDIFGLPLTSDTALYIECEEELRAGKLLDFLFKKGCHTAMDKIDASLSILENDFAAIEDSSGKRSATGYSDFLGFDCVCLKE